MTILFIAIFGGLGGMCRYLLGISIPNVWGIPLVTLLVNIIGSFCLPIWNNYLGLKLNNKIKVAIGTGFIGAFTTFSGMIIDILKMYLTNNYSGLVIYILASIVLGFVAALLGMKTAMFFKKEAK
ncbi:putative fluoride ion transporter CrcB 2 [Companilactobacillus sp. RD055328]|uniref:fluoride efflux transporter FluC n=1 Tax=Companilactobacillus sp. RD055328 TaxID=2916634 RepID=UPI001FC88359|nr:CrcB family protein [Companilactobacillus sp. RD055328]GKQ42421.1 putative fluoride ion transporter CrcB 2 [Companilactobacillus sp. RD055328]